MGKNYITDLKLKGIIPLQMNSIILNLVKYPVRVGVGGGRVVQKLAQVLRAVDAVPHARIFLHTIELQ